MENKIKFIKMFLRVQGYRNENLNINIIEFTNKIISFEVIGDINIKQTYTDNNSKELYSIYKSM